MEKSINQIEQVTRTSKNNFKDIAKMKTDIDIQQERNLVLSAITYSNNPITMSEIRKITGIDFVSLRLTELHRAGLIIKTNDGGVNLFAAITSI